MIDEMKHLLYYLLGGDLRSFVYVSLLRQKTSQYSLCSEV